ncbi:MAG: hypothetical protein V3T72_17040 [Thermoanaerobaculia bacterium]
MTWFKSPLRHLSSPLRQPFAVSIALHRYPGSARGPQVYNVGLALGTLEAEPGDRRPAIVEDPDVEELRHGVLKSYAETALAQKDLALARLQANQLAAGSDRADLLERVDRSLGHRRAVARHRRLALCRLHGLEGSSRSENETEDSAFDAIP